MSTKQSMHVVKPSLIIAAILISLILALVSVPRKVRADIVTCNDGSVHSSPTADYACLGPGENGVKSVAPNKDDASKPGDVCPANFARAGQKIPAGADGTWCSGLSTEQPEFVVNDCNDVIVNKENCGIIKYLLIFINGLSALVGIVVVAMIILGGIQYTSAGDNPQMVSAAKKRIFNAVLALVIFIFMFTFLQWLVPGGIFSSSTSTSRLNIERVA